MLRRGFQHHGLLRQWLDAIGLARVCKEKNEQFNDMLRSRRLSSKPIESHRGFVVAIISTEVSPSATYSTFNYTFWYIRIRMRYEYIMPRFWVISRAARFCVWEWPESISTLWPPITIPSVSHTTDSIIKLVYHLPLWSVEDLR